MSRYVQAAKQRVQRGIYHLGGAALAPNGPLDVACMAELKPASPSAGQLLRRPVPDVLQDFVAGGATSLSVLADGSFFAGSPALVRSAHASGLPLLWKDFVVDPKQIDCAAHCGASAVLLIERYLSPHERDALIAHAHDKQLQVLLEVHGAVEAASARASKADFLGVNARNLETLKMDRAGARQVIADLATDGRPVVALSGIGSPHDLAAARAAGAGGALVGTRLLLDPRPDLVLKALQRPLAKVCGLTTPEDMDMARDAGADLLGVVVDSPGPRSVTPNRAGKLLRRAGRQGVMVTSQADIDAVRNLALELGPAFLQTHTPLDAESVAELGAKGILVLHAVGPEENQGTGYGVILDSAVGKGGTGTTHDWKAAAERVDRAHFHLIAGGLDGTCAAAAIATSRAWGADASSKLESKPGVKDRQKVAAFVAACHGAA